MSRNRYIPEQIIRNLGNRKKLIVGWQTEYQDRRYLL
jgi:hypothetical protein